MFAKIFLIFILFAGINFVLLAQIILNEQKVERQTSDSKLHESQIIPCPIVNRLSVVLIIVGSDSSNSGWKSHLAKNNSFKFLRQKMKANRIVFLVHDQCDFGPSTKDRITEKEQLIERKTWPHNLSQYYNVSTICGNLS